MKIEHDFVSIIMYLFIALAIYAAIVIIGTLFGYDWDFTGLYESPHYEPEIYAP